MKEGHELGLPPGFRFHPTDDELVSHYLCRRCAGQPISVPIIAEIDLYKFDPWQLPDMAHYGEKEWYFFSPRDRKYPNGSRPNRAAGSGYWKATGADKPIGRPKTLAIKKALVFYTGKAPKGIKTNWIMHEYRLANVDRSAGNKKNQRLDDWVLCRIYNKKGIIEKPYSPDRKLVNYPEGEDVKPNILMPNQSATEFGASILINDRENFQQFDMSEDSMAGMHTDSSSSEHVLSPEDGVAHSEPKWNHVGFDFSLESDCSFQKYEMPGQRGIGYELPSDVDLSHFDTYEESVPHCHTDSSSSGHVLSPEEEVVQSEPNWSNLGGALDFGCSEFYSFQKDDPLELLMMDEMPNAFASSQEPF